MATLELFGSARCPHTSEMRDWLEWKRADFVEYDVEAEDLRRDLQEFLHKLQENELIEIRPPDVSGQAKTE